MPLLEKDKIRVKPWVAAISVATTFTVCVTLFVPVLHPGIIGLGGALFAMEIFFFMAICHKKMFAYQYEHVQNIFERDMLEKDEAIKFALCFICCVICPIGVALVFCPPIGIALLGIFLGTMAYFSTCCIEENISSSALSSCSMFKKSSMTMGSYEGNTLQANFN